MFPYMVNFKGITIGSYGFLLLIAALLALFVFWKRAKEEYYEEFEVFDLTLVAGLWALLLGRLGYVALHFRDFGFNLWQWLAVWQKPGYWWVGLLAGGAWTVVRMCEKKRWNLFKTYDLLVIGLALFQSLESFGRFLAGAGIGRVTSLPIGVQFAGLFEKRHPVGLYGFLLWLLVFWFLWWAEGRYRRFVWYQKSKGDARPGFLTFTYLIFFGLIGMVIELLSESRIVYWGVNWEYLTRLGVFMIGLVGLYLRSGLEGRTEIREWWQRRTARSGLR